MLPVSHLMKKKERSMDLGLRGRLAIVCAASGGLGKAAATGFVREGANVVICSRVRGRIDAAAEEIRRAAADPSVRVLPLVADLSKAADVSALVSDAVREFGRVDILVTNAGGPPVADFPDLDDATWEKGVDLTLMSTIRCIRAVLPHMQRGRWGRIINITSIAARQPINDLVISSTLRPGILGLGKVLANQYAREGILVNNLTPGFIWTDRQREIASARASKRGITTEQYVAEVVRDIPMGRFGEPAELASVIVFLGSEMAGYVTGTTLAVDGGLSKGLL
jgi:3-oxoacyl-[acyl-carrier protein] reductase